MKNLNTRGYQVKSLCSYVGISRQAYYNRIHQSNNSNDLYNRMEDLVKKNRSEKSRVGLRTIYYKEDISALLGVNQFERQMSNRGYALKPYKSFIKTTDSRGHQYKFNNLIEGKEVNGPNQVIVGDITYYSNSSGLYYIFHFTDIYSLEIKGIIGSKNMEGINAEKCMRQIIKYNRQNKYGHKLIIHTDGGGQYRSHNFQNMIRNAEILPSHAKSCFENGLAERVNGIIKNEYLIDYNIKNEKQLNRALKQIQKQSNNKWPSKTLNYRTPQQYTNWVRELKLKDRPVKLVKVIQK